MSYYEFSRVIQLNSLDRIAGTNGNMIIDMPIDQDQHDFDSVCLISASIPKSYYLIQQGFNTFILQEDATPKTIIIDPGNYSVSSFIVKIITILNIESPNGLTYSASFNYDTGKLTFFVVPNAFVSSFIFTNAVFEVFGFNSNSTNTLTGFKLTSVNVVDFAVEVNIFIRSDICSVQNNDILASISSAGVPNFSYIRYICPDILACTRPISKFNNQHRFTLTNDRSNDDIEQQILNLNGVNMILTLLLYKKSNISEIIKQYIKIKTLV